MSDQKSIIVIGAGIAGLSAGVYAQMNGYRTRIFEMHTLPGGLMTAWKRKGYTIDGCIHWLTGSSPAYPGYYHYWQEIGLIQGREIFDPEVFARVEGRGGEVLEFFCDTNRFEQHLLALSPEDEAYIRQFCKAIRVFRDFTPPAPVESLDDFLKMLAGLPAVLRALPTFRAWAGRTMKEFAGGFKNPLLRLAFGEIWYPEMTAVGLLATMAMLDRKGAGYPLGGSLPMAYAVEKRFLDLGGEIFYNRRVEEILVENGAAVGVKLSDGQVERADIVISAADGYATIFKMLGGRFRDPKLDKLFAEGKIFQPLVYIGLGITGSLPEPYGVTGGIVRYLDEPVTVAGKTVDRLSFSIHNYDPSLAPPGHTVLTVMIDSTYAPWKELAEEPERYEAEKERIALEVIDRLDKRFPGFAGRVEMANVATPLTFERFTGNWQGSFEGWLPTPQNVMTPTPKTLPGLANFYMVGQWVQPGGGLPSGVMTGRAVLQKICKADKKKFRAPID